MGAHGAASGDSRNEGARGPEVAHMQSAIRAGECTPGRRRRESAERAAASGV